MAASAGRFPATAFTNDCPAAMTAAVGASTSFSAAVTAAFVPPVVAATVMSLRSAASWDVVGIGSGAGGGTAVPAEPEVVVPGAGADILRLATFATGCEEGAVVHCIHKVWKDSAQKRWWPLTYMRTTRVGRRHGWLRTTVIWRSGAVGEPEIKRTCAHSCVVTYDWRRDQTSPA